MVVVAAEGVAVPNAGSWMGSDDLELLAVCVRAVYLVGGLRRSGGGGWLRLEGASRRADIHYSQAPPEDKWRGGCG